jgi:hypothetical protein
LAVIVQNPVLFARTVTVAVETPPANVELPTVQTLVVAEEKVTRALDVTDAEMVTDLGEGEEPTFEGWLKVMALGNPTTTTGSIYIDAPKILPPVASWEPLTNLNLYHPV